MSLRDPDWSESPSTGLRGAPLDKPNILSAIASEIARSFSFELARSHSYDMGPAERDFGYREQVSMRDVTDRLAKSDVLVA